MLDKKQHGGRRDTRKRRPDDGRARNGGNVSRLVTRITLPEPIARALRADLEAQSIAPTKANVEAEVARRLGWEGEEDVTDH